MNYLWGGMIVVGVIFGALHGGFGQITEAAVDSAKEAVSLVIAMAGVVAMWSGLMEIAQQTGMLGACAKKLRPLLKFLFPDLPKESRANELIATNFIANIFGLGWAATPAGLEAMQELEKLEDARRAGTPSTGVPRKTSGRGKGAALPKGVASREMCTFLLLNISSLQLIPVNMIAYRSQYGSVNPAAVVGPGIVATMVSTLAAVVCCKIMNFNKRGA